MALASQQQSPVRMYVDDDVRLPRRLSTFLKERIDNLSVSVLQGELKADDYRSLTGMIRGFQIALDECERITEEIAS